MRFGINIYVWLTTVGWFVSVGVLFQNHGLEPIRVEQIVNRAVPGLLPVTPPVVKSGPQDIFVTTGVMTDLAVDGAGYFFLRDPVTQQRYATRTGDFRIDGLGHLVHPTGFRVQGFSDSNLSIRGDVLLNSREAPPNTVSGAIANISISVNSKIDSIPGNIRGTECDPLWRHKILRKIVREFQICAIANIRDQFPRRRSSILRC